jgi:hypothetical protein
MDKNPKKTKVNGTQYPKTREDLIDRMVKSYRKRKREQKIDKLLNSDDHWKGLS